MTGNAPAHDGPFEQHDTFDMSWVRGPRFTRDERQSFKAANGLTDGQTDLAEASVLYRHMVSPTPASELALTRRPTLSSKLGLSGKLGLNRNFGDKPTHSILETNVKSLSGRMSRKPSTSRSEPFKVEERRLLGEFANMTGKTLIGLPSFKKALKVKGDDFAERLFASLDPEKSGFVSDKAFVRAVLALDRGTVEDRIAFAFNLMDVEHKGRFTHEQLCKVLKASCAESNVSIDDIAVGRLANAFFASAGKPPSDGMTLEQFTAVLSTRPELQRSIQLCSSQGFNVNHMPKRMDLPWLEDKLTRLLARLNIEDVAWAVWITLTLLGQVAGFVIRFLKQKNTPGKELDGWGYPIAKGAAGSIQVVLILFFIPIARRTLTLLRQTPLHHALPIDRSIAFHKYLAACFAFWSTLHTLAHLANSSYATDRSRAIQWLRYSPTKPQPTLSEYFAEPTQITGLLLVCFLFFGMLLAIPWGVQSKRLQKNAVGRWWKRKQFVVFWASHQTMAVSVVILLIFHPIPGPVVNPIPHHSTTWVYMLVGVAVLLTERIIRLLQQATWRSEVINAQCFKGSAASADVVELKLTRPTWAKASWVQPFRYKPGQYAFLNVPALSSEWHPFSITSAPHDPYISFHIQAVGDWTNSLRELMQGISKKQDPPNIDVEAAHDSQDDDDNQRLHAFEGFMTSSDNPTSNGTNNTASSSQPSHSGEHLTADSLSELRASHPYSAPWTKPPKIFIDGPFGAPAQKAGDFDVVLLVGFGIGVTPFISKLRDLVNKVDHARCKVCHTPNELLQTQKVYFFWVVREPSALSYFKDTLEVIKADYAHILDVHIHVTSVVESNDLRVTLAKVARDMHFEAQGEDLLGGGAHVPVPTFFGRPKWGEVFKNIQSRHSDATVGVFACGPLVGVNQLKAACLTSNKACNRVKFVFHRETF